MIAVTARDVPEIRARMTNWARDPALDGAGNWFRFFLGPSPDGATESRVFDRVDDVGATIVATLAAQLPAAELFYVSADMTDLARHAADTLTDYRLHPEDLPAQIGVMVYEHPPVEGTAAGRHNDVSVVSWGPGRGGLWVHTWATTSASQQGIVRIGRTLAQLPHDEMVARARSAAARNLPEPTPENKPSESEEIADQTADHVLATFLSNLERAQVPPSFAPPHGYEWCALTPMEFTEMEGWPGGVSEGKSSGHTDTRIALQRTILATWLLMGQTLVRSEPMTAPRAARRRIERLDPMLDPTVRYIDLRRARTEPSDRPDDDVGKGTREYRHRWIVRGHWRNQYYPSRNDHRPIWIDPHFADPEDKPLLGGERVNVLRR
ncbi:hypothetical protein [Umezawaea sp. Da 62-37]|uniref:hypothetical protein n=1 Tax=Umezawaea sp. Da 62-37 TaxID=3075927 RepID=UPI0028F70B88|nr:hypothetical protein [Umezawaea sp. Da 62-37]WNV90197.1 hypothetical protein RM788_18465 [Umezawaea sp. Da 62-37]